MCHPPAASAPRRLGLVLTDGLAVHSALRPDLVAPEQITAVVRLHLDALDSA